MERMGRRELSKFVVLVVLVALVGACSSSPDPGTSTDSPSDTSADTQVGTGSGDDLHVDQTVAGSETVVRDVEVGAGEKITYRFDLADGLGYDVLVPDDVADRMDSAEVRQERNYDTEEESPPESVLREYEGFTPLKLTGAKESHDTLSGTLTAPEGGTDYRFLFWSRSGDEKTVLLVVRRIS